jgi:outer membrane protein assembly factor BamB
MKFEIRSAMKKILFSFLLLLISILSFSQSDALWKINIAHRWHRITSLGYLVVGSTGYLTGINPANGTTMWQSDYFGTVEDVQVDEIPGTSLLKIAHGVNPGEADLPMIGIVDILSGKIIFDSNEQQLGVLATYVLPKSGNLLVVGVKPGDFSAKLLMYSLDNGSMLWKNDDIFRASAGGKGGMLSKMAAAVKTVSNMQALIAPPVEMDDQSIVIVHPNYVIRLQANDGKQLWRTAIDEAIGASVIQSPYASTSLFVATSAEMATNMMTSDNANTSPSVTTTYHGFDINSGQLIWKTRPITETLNLTLPLKAGLAVFYSNTPKATINLLDYKTGNGLWGGKGKGFKTQGNVIDYIQTKEGIVLSLAGVNALNNLKEEHFLNILDEKTGLLKFEKSIKVKGRLLTTEIVPKGILYTTTHEVNILDPVAGTLVLPASIESEAPKRNMDSPFPMASSDRYLYVYATRKGSVMELDKQTAAVRQLNTTPIEFGGKELPKSIDLFAEGVVLASDQNVLMLGYDGKLKHVKYYQPPTQSNWVRAISMAEAVAHVYAGVMLLAAAGEIKDAAAATQNTELKQQGRAAAMGMGAVGLYAFAYAGQALKEFNRRVKATTATDEYLLLISEPVKKDIKLIQVDKRTGKVLTTIDIGKDRDPQYTVDFIDRKVYYLSKYNELTCYQLR